MRILRTCLDRSTHNFDRILSWILTGFEMATETYYIDELSNHRVNDSWFTSQWPLPILEIGKGK